MSGRMELLKLIFSTSIIWLISFAECVTSETCSFSQSGTSIVAFCENGCCSGGCCTPSQTLSVAIIAVIVIVIVLLIMLVTIVIVCCMWRWNKKKYSKEDKTVSTLEMRDLPSTNSQLPQYHREHSFVRKPSRKRNNQQVHFNSNYNTSETSFSIVSTT